MRPIGFSTGALAFSDFRRGLEIARRCGPVVELSALREWELEPIVAAIDELHLSPFSYVGFHAPSAIAPDREPEVVDLLRAAANRGWPVVVHPDAMCDPGQWSDFGDLLCLENMDKRKPTGRDRGELAQYFERFPNASFCLDLGHARQVDPTMTEAYFLLKQFGHRLKQVHLSEVTTASKHERLSWGAISAMKEIAHLVPTHVPIILESVVPEEEAPAEVDRARRALPSVEASLRNYPTGPVATV